MGCSGSGHFSAKPHASQSSALEEHWGYVADPVRLERFRRSIGSVVKPGDLVADLGCGSGVLTLLSLQAAAGHVYAIDNSRMLAVARESIARCGFGDRVSFIQGRSQKVELPERVDVVLCDHVGWFGFDYDILALLADARRRFLKSDGVVIPSVIELKLAAVESEACRAVAERWSDADVPAAYRWLRHSSINSKHSVDLDTRELLSPPADLGALALRDDQSDYLSWSAHLRVERDGELHGLGGWFDCELATGVRMTNSPLATDRIDRPQVFLPIEAPVRVFAGDSLNATITARPADHLLGWSVAVPTTGQCFSHSTWQGMVLASDDLIRSNPDRVPRPSAEAAARAVVLGYCDGKRSVRDIEHAVLRDHPSLFPSCAEISLFVVQVLGRDTVL
jgi:ubiquinone/menaquinone biosynthesis C-methylase UbiE